MTPKLTLANDSWMSDCFLKIFFLAVGNWKAALESPAVMSLQYCCDEKCFLNGALEDQTCCLKDEITVYTLDVDTTGVNRSVIFIHFHGCTTINLTCHVR